MSISVTSTGIGSIAGQRLHLQGAGGPLSVRDFLAALEGAPDAADVLTRALAELPYRAFAWECRAINAAALDAPIEMVAIDSPALARASADPQPFAEQLASAAASVVAFDNLGGNARLIAPCQLSEPACYAHLATFVRAAPREQTRALFRLLAREVTERLAGRRAPLWLSTAGLGVSWLHVRLDDRPKYYRYGPFRHV